MHHNQPFTGRTPLVKEQRRVSFWYFTDNLQTTDPENSSLNPRNVWSEDVTFSAPHRRISRGRGLIHYRKKLSKQADDNKYVTELQFFWRPAEVPAVHQLLSTFITPAWWLYLWLQEWDRWATDRTASSRSAHIWKPRTHKHTPPLVEQRSPEQPSYTWTGTFGPTAYIKMLVCLKGRGFMVSEGRGQMTPAVGNAWTCSRASKHRLKVSGIKFTCRDLSQIRQIETVKRCR